MRSAPLLGGFTGVDSHSAPATRSLGPQRAQVSAPTTQEHNQQAQRALSSLCSPCHHQKGVLVDLLWLLPVCWLTRACSRRQQHTQHIHKAHVHLLVPALPLRRRAAALATGCQVRGSPRCWQALLIADGAACWPAVQPKQSVGVSATDRMQLGSCQCLLLARVLCANERPGYCKTPGPPLLQAPTAAVCVQQQLMQQRCLCQQHCSSR